MTGLGWAFLVIIWAVLTVLTGWCFKMVLMPGATEKEGQLPPSGRM